MVDVTRLTTDRCDPLRVLIGKYVARDVPTKPAATVVTNPCSKRTCPRRGQGGHAEKAADLLAIVLVKRVDFRCVFEHAMDVTRSTANGGGGRTVGNFYKAKGIRLRLVERPIARRNFAVAINPQKAIRPLNLGRAKDSRRRAGSCRFHLLPIRMKRHPGTLCLESENVARKLGSRLRHRKGPHTLNRYANVGEGCGDRRVRLVHHDANRADLRTTLQQCLGNGPGGRLD